MAKVKNLSGQALSVPALGRMVLAGQVVEVPDALAFGLTQQDIWQADDADAKKAHKDGETARDERVAAEHRARIGVVEDTTEGD